MIGCLSGWSPRPDQTRSRNSYDCPLPLFVHESQTCWSRSRICAVIRMWLGCLALVSASWDRFDGQVSVSGLIAIPAVTIRGTTKKHECRGSDGWGTDCASTQTSSWSMGCRLDHLSLSTYVRRRGAANAAPRLRTTSCSLSDRNVSAHGSDIDRRTHRLVAQVVEAVEAAEHCFGHTKIRKVRWQVVDAHNRHTSKGDIG